MSTRSTCLAFVLLNVLASGVALAETPEQKGLDIAKKSDAAQTGFLGETNEAELTIISASGDKATRKMKGSRIEMKDDGDRSVLTLTYPADVKGVRLLTWAHKKGSDDQWLYLPSAKRVKRISGRDKTGSFMGSEFTLEDMAVGFNQVEKYTYKYLRDDTLGGQKMWVVEQFPVDKHSGYSKTTVWVDQVQLVVKKSEFYDKKGKLLKTATMDGYTKVDKWWRPTTVTMDNVQTHKKSSFEFKDRKFGKVSGDAFDPESLSE